MPLAIRARDLVKDYGDVRALDGLDLAVESGEFFGLLGPNGAGKTTFINILVGLVHSTDGDVAVFGHDVEREYQQARDAIGLAPQEFNVDRFFPIKEVLEHKAGYHGISRREASRRAEAALRTVGIYDKRDTRFDWLSGGMKRRFMLARALVSDPDLLILDEPTAGVDVELRRDLCHLITDLNDDGTTILLTTHYIEEAEAIADRIAVINKGQILLVEDKANLMTRMGQKELSIDLGAPLSAIPAPLSDFPLHLSKDGMKLTYRYDTKADRTGIGRLMSLLVQEGCHVRDVHTAQNSLEDIFIGLVAQQEQGDIV